MIQILHSECPSDDHRNFTDDIALISDEIERAQQSQLRVEEECGKVGLGLNAKNAKYLTYNISPGTSIMFNRGYKIERVLDVKYLGLWVNKTEKDIKAWTVNA